MKKIKALKKEKPAFIACTKKKFFGHYNRL